MMKAFCDPAPHLDYYFLFVFACSVVYLHNLLLAVFLHVFEIHFLGNPLARADAHDSNVCWFLKVSVPKCWTSKLHPLICPVLIFRLLSAS